MRGGGWRVRATTIWAKLHTGRGGGDRVKNERALTMNGNGWRGDSKEGETNDPKNGKIKRWDRRSRLKCKDKR